MIKALVQPNKPAPPTPKGFVKVTNTRKGEILLPCAPFVLQPGVSYHDEKHFDEMPPAIVAALQAHAGDGDLRFEAADVAPPAPAPVAFVPAPAVDAPPVQVPALASDPVEAAKQIAAETNHAILSSWFDQGQTPAISDLLLNRHVELNPA